MLADLSAVLDRSTIEPVVAGSAAAQLESTMYDLALAIMRWADEAHDAEEVSCLRASLTEMESRLLWVQQNRFDADGARTREELRAAHHQALDIVDVLGRVGIVVDPVEAEERASSSGQNPPEV